MRTFQRDAMKRSANVQVLDAQDRELLRLNFQGNGKAGDDRDADAGDNGMFDCLGAAQRHDRPKAQTVRRQGTLDQ